MQVSQVIYQAPQDVFLQDVESKTVLEKMLCEARAQGMAPGDAEQRSWVNNAPKIAELIRLSGVKDTYVTFEYLLPRRLQRIDCMIYGKDSMNHPNAIHIELKQWGNNTVKASHSAGNFQIDENVTALTGGTFREVAHPSQQVRGYHDYLTHYIEIISKEELALTGVAYCYNYHKMEGGHTATLYSPQFDALQKEHRTYSKEEVQDLADKIHEILVGGDGFSIFNKMMSSRVCQSQKLLDSIAGMMEDQMKDKFNLLDEQIAAKNAIFDKIRKLKESGQKHIIVVHGGPGTGKTVIALDILASLAKTRYQVQYATKSASLVNAIHYQLPRGNAAKKVITGLTEFNPRKCESNALDVLMIDEAHRIEEYYKEGFGRQARKITEMPMVDALLRVTKVLVAFIDDKQAIRSSEVGSTQMLDDCARRNNVPIEHIHLFTQFRCSGSDNYLDWLDQILYNQPITSSFSTKEYDFRVMNSPQAVYDAIAEKMKEGMTARMMAGFCWPWSDGLDTNGMPIKDVTIGDFAMPWESHRNWKIMPQGYVKWYEWAYRPEGFKQVGCIYTAQGFEFDYAGVIIGPDLKWDEATKSIITDQTASKDPMLNKARQTESFDRYCRNIYRVLMSRGMKGTYIYCCDKVLQCHIQTLLNANNYP